MAEFKLAISNTKGITVQRELKGDDAKPLIGKKIGEKINGELINLAGYELEITGGSDYCGFPMRKDVRGVGRKKILAISGIGIKKEAKGTRQRKTVCGNTIHDKIVQVNMKVLKEGKENIFQAKETEKPAKEKKKEEKKEEKPKEEKKAESDKEKVKEKKEIKEEKKAEESKKEAP